MERISLGEMPDCHGDSASWLDHPQHLANRINGRREKHHAEAAHYCIESVSWKRQLVGERHLKVGILISPAVRLAPGSFHHFRNWIHAQNFALRPHQAGNAQCRFSRTSGYIEDKLAASDLCVFYESLSNRCKHSANNLPVLLPVRSRFAPLANDFIFILLHRSCLLRNFHFDFSGGHTDGPAFLFSVGW